MLEPDFKPTFCCPQAYAGLEASLPAIETVNGLIDAALAVAMHVLDDVDPAETKRTLEDLADSVLSRVQSREPKALLAHLHEVLFEEEGFAGEVADYHNPRNSLLPCVLKSRRGMPILLSLVYYLVGERIGLKTNGVNTPWHFLSSVTVGKSVLYIDPFFGGRSMSGEEVIAQLTKASGEPIPESYGDPLRTSTHREWLVRMVRNLETSFTRREEYDDVAAMIEIRSLIERCPPQSIAA